MLRKPTLVHTHGLILHTQALHRLKAIMLRVYYGPIFRSCSKRVASPTSTSDSS
jgi:hypothetical protein